MKNIVLTGFMGAGKSTVGKGLSEKLGIPMVDTDELIERESGLSIEEIFSKHGAAYFRELEKEAVEKVSTLEDHLVITGGGVVLDKENMENLRKNGIIIYLHAQPEVLYRRVKKHTHRPLLRVKNPLKRIYELLENRARFYSDNDLQIDTSDLCVEEVVDEIVKRLQSLNVL
jgi:shikimate kinase